MEITEEYLLKLKAEASAQRQQAIYHLQQADGAIAMVDVMLARLKEEPVV